jgi:hypothetical protein
MARDLHGGSRGQAKYQMRPETRDPRPETKGQVKYQMEKVFCDTFY